MVNIYFEVVPQKDFLTICFLEYRTRMRRSFLAVGPRNPANKKKKKKIYNTMRQWGKREKSRFWDRRRKVG